MWLSPAIPVLLLTVIWSWTRSPLAGSTGSGSSSTRDAVQRGPQSSQRAAFIARLEATPAPAFKKELGLRQAIDRLAAAADVEITGLWSDRFDPGLDPERPVSVDLRPRASCMEALEGLLYQVDDGGEPILWQTTRFGLEVGARAALWRPRAIETRTYDVKDLLLRVPAFRSTGVPQAGGAAGGQGGAAGGGQGSGGGQGGGAGGGGAGGNTEDSGAGERREGRTKELIELIQRTVEPEAWQAMGGPCSIAARDGVLIIRAPDFVHRRIEDPAAPAPRKPRKPDHGDGK